MKEQILSKVLNKDGSLIWAFSKPQYIQKYFTPQELTYLKSCFGKTVSEKYYCLKYNITEQPKCPCCGKPLKFNSFKEGYHKYCSSSCRSKSVIFTGESKQKRRETNLVRFGYIGGPWSKLEVKETVKTSEAQKLISRRYVYHGEKFDSSWELYYWIYCKEQGYQITRNFRYFTFVLDGKQRRFYPDFIINGELVEIKGDHLKLDVYKTQLWQAKEQICKKEHIKILSESEMKPIIKWVQDKFGKKYVKQFKQKTEKDIKRQIIEFTSVEEAFKYRNSNIKFHYKCINCGQDVYTTWYLATHFNDRLCKHCRKNN